MPTSVRPPVLTLNDLVALSDEIAALVRAGVPLERGLGEIGRDMPGRLGQFAVRLAEETSRGRPLSEVLADPSWRLPKVYRAVVEAGLRAGRLPAALESLAGAMRRLAETRRGIALAALYPLLVLFFACGFFAFFTMKIAPQMLKSFSSMGVPGAGVFRPLAGIGQWTGVWAPLFESALIGLALLWWHAATRATVADSRWSAWLFGWLPWFHRGLRLTRTATFTEILTLLVEHQVPLDEALTLAAEAAGDARLAARPATLPPLLRWLMAGGRNEAVLLPALKRAAESYHRRAQHQADVAQVVLPALFTLGLGGTVVFAYALALLGPYSMLLKSLAGG